MSDTWPKSLAEALAILMTRLPEIRKDQTAKVKTDKANYSYSYADLAQISGELLPVLGELGLSFTSRPTLIDGQFVLDYELLHVSGESKGGHYPLPTSGAPQAVGSAITYARRYCLCAVTGVAPGDDDDGAAAQTDWHQARTEPRREHPPAQVNAQATEQYRTLIDAADDRPSIVRLAREARNAGADMAVLGPVIEQRQAELSGAPS